MLQTETVVEFHCWIFRCTCAGGCAPQRLLRVFSLLRQRKRDVAITKYLRQAGKRVASKLTNFVPLCSEPFLNLTWQGLGLGLGLGGNRTNTLGLGGNSPNGFFWLVCQKYVSVFFSYSTASSQLNASFGFDLEMSLSMHNYS